MSTLLLALLLYLAIGYFIDRMVWDATGLVHYSHQDDAKVQEMRFLITFAWPPMLYLWAAISLTRMIAPHWFKEDEA